VQLGAGGAGGQDLPVGVAMATLVEVDMTSMIVVEVALTVDVKV